MTDLRPSLVLMAALAGCGEAWSVQQRVLRVHAASSLTESFQDLEAAFEAAHPDIDVQLTFAGSQVLRLQLEQGASADVFAPADPAHLQALARAGEVAQSEVFAHNQLVLVTPRDNPAGLTQFSDLPRAQRLVMGTDTVPVGAYARQALSIADTRVEPGFASAVMEHVVSFEPNTRLVRAKVALGEADAALIYRTDVTDDVDLNVIELPSDIDVQAEYAIGTLTDAENPEGAALWLAFLRSDEARRVLEKHGFRAR